MAIIALIAVPMIMNIIEQARKEAAVSSTRSYIKATEAYAVLSELDQNKEILKSYNRYNITAPTMIEEKTYEAINNLVEIKGTKPSGSDDYVILDDSHNVIEAKLTINGYEILVENYEIVSITKNGKTENIETENIIIQPVNGSVEIGATLKLKVTVTGNSDKTVTWTSSDESVATVDNNGVVTGIKIGEVSITATTSNGKIATSTITVGELLVNKVQIGDYVAYDAGEWTETKTRPTSQGEFGGYTKGQSKSDTIDYCNASNETSTLKGWRVLKIDNNEIYLIHAGVPECYYHTTSNHSIESVTTLNSHANIYLNQTYATSAHMLTYDEAIGITGNASSTTNNLRYLGASGTTNRSIYYWLASLYSNDYLWYVGRIGHIDYKNDSGALGIRPVVILKSNVKTMGKTKDIFNQEAWSLVAA